LTPILNPEILEKFRTVSYTIQDLLCENFSQWFIFESKELVAASSLDLIYKIFIFFSFGKHIHFANSKKKF